MTVTVTEAGHRALVAAEVMSTPPVSIAAGASVARAWALMSEAGLRHLVVVTSDDRCAGVVDDRAVFAEWPMGPLALRRRCVGQIMRQPTGCALPTASLQQVAQVMVRDGVDAVPVVTVDGVVVGIVTGSDLAAAVAGG